MPSTAAICRHAFKVRGIVQGVGFRPYVARVASELGLVGWVQNDRDGASIEVEGSDAALAAFYRALQSIPAPASITDIERNCTRPTNETCFTIRASDTGAPVGAALPSDLATCDACVEEVFAPGRRHRYAFTNCASCGPRYTLVARLPYDRENTSMAPFTLCDDCRREYQDIHDRRFHAEPVACPTCGPQLELLDGSGTCLGLADEALNEACKHIERGDIVAVLGIGGFQLLVDATNEFAVERLRARKHRPDKPFALMLRDLPSVRRYCELSDQEAQLLQSPSAPIVLLRPVWTDTAQQQHRLAPGVAPGSRWLGALLPTTPLHHLILDQLKKPVVCTSGNRVDEPICISAAEAIERLGDVADVLLTHDRPVLRPVDDSVARMTSRGPEILRRARGYSGRPVARLPTTTPLLALGAHQKSTIALGVRGDCIMSQHLGDLSDVRSEDTLRATVEDLLKFFDLCPSVVACDLHPNYVSTRLAEELSSKYGATLCRVQHHHAHVASVMAVHGITQAVSGLSWDGAGHGADGTVWGGELLRVDTSGYQRVARLTSFPLPGGDLASRQPWRAALGLLSTLGDDAHWVHAPSDALGVASQALRSGLNVWPCTSMGRLFDAVANLILGGQPGLPGRCAVTCSFEGQAAMMLEAFAASERDVGAYPLPLVQRGADWEGDLQPLVRSLLEDRRQGVARSIMARRFHEALVIFGVACARLAGVDRVVLSGGCFQNLVLREGLIERLAREGHEVFAASDVPTNDGGISLGQAWVAAHLAAGAAG